MSFNMNDCKVGDKLVSCHGMILTYVGLTSCDKFRHRVQYPNGSFGSRTDDGQVFTHSKLPEDHDIVGFAE